MFAAKGTVEPPVVERSMAALFEADRPWIAERLPLLDERVRVRLGELSHWLAGRHWLEEEKFSAADIVMVTVLRRLGGSGLLEEQPTVAAYVTHGEARSAFKRAFDAQRAVFIAAATENVP